MDLFERYPIESLDVAKKLLEESRSGFLKLFFSSPVCMSMTTPQRTYVRVNHQFLEKFGYSEAEIIGRTSVDFGILDEEESRKVGKLIREKGRLHNDYVKCRTKDGRIVHTISSIEEMEMGGETYLISFFQDITTIIEQQNIIEQHVHQLEAVNKDLEAFSSSVSHDLRAPLRAINGYSKMLEEDFEKELPDDAKRILETIRDNSARMGELIDGLLEFSRSGRKPLVKEPLDMEQLAKDVVKMLKPTARPETAFTVQTLPEIDGDLFLVNQLLVNLISNAVKYSSKKEQPQVEIGFVPGSSETIYFVKDNGAGFDMRYADKLFGVFQRLHRRSEFEGVGIGLSLAQRIVTKHGGKIWAEGKTGEGATFYFSMPK